EAGASNDIVIKKTSDDSTIETIDAQDGKVTGSGTTTITINPAATLDDNIEYYVQVGTDSFDDTAGNSYAGITDTTSWSFTTGDYTSPTVSTLSPADDATSIQNISDLVITFDENVDIESGNVTIKRSTNDATVETIDVTGGQVTGTGTDTITIDPSSVLNALTEYYVQIDATAFDDANSNSFAGILDTTSWSFTTKSGGSSSVTSAPSPSLGGVDSEDGSGSSSGSSNATVTGVTGSTTVEAGDDVKVQWSSNSSVRLVNIYVSYDGGLTYEFVEGPIINTDNYSWDLPYDIDADSVKFKIEGTDLAEVIASIETDEIAIDVQDDCDCDIDEGTEQDDQEGQNDGVGDSIAEDSGSGLLELIDDAIEELLDGLIDEIEGVAQEVLEIIVPSFERDLTFGVTGEDVKELQQFLNSNGYNIAQDGAGSAGNETEYFGELTRQALVSWQQDNGLPAFGYFGPLTRELISSQGIVIEDIIDVDEIQEGEDVEVVFDRDLTLGSKGEDVRELQKYLNKSGYILADSGPGSRGNETDYFGELTRQALIKFQKAVGIKPAAGYFGPITRSFIK
ncbi:hypothetical protein HN699_05135, partial [Candidatus Uhrbacteria bacterium]|nr:hypothetical protein [Candidatus Uhrbacteria bacterium]